MEITIKGAEIDLTKIDSLSSRLDSTANSLAEMRVRLNDLWNNFEGLQEQIGDVDSRMDEVQKTVSDILVDTRIDELAESLAQINENISDADLKGNIETLYTRNNKLDRQIQQLRGSIDHVCESMGVLETRSEQLEEQHTDMEEHVLDLNKRMDDFVK